MLSSNDVGYDNKLNYRKCDVKNKKIKRRCIFTITTIIAVVLSFIVVFLGCWTISSYYKIGGVPVMNYHAVNDINHSSLVVTTSDFRDDMKYLANNGYTSITMDELYNYLVHNESLPDKPVLITFDDGYTDNYTNAFPILKEYHMQATLFMIGDAIGTDRFLSAEQLKEMDANGFHIEAHTYSHKRLTNLDDMTLQADLAKSRTVLESLLQRPIRYLAYPQGFNNELVQQRTKDAGYLMAFTVAPGTVKPGDNLFTLNRLSIFEGLDHWWILRLRMHVPEIIRVTWHLRDILKDNGFVFLSQLVPLF